MFNTPDSPAKTPGGYTTQGGNFWTLITPEIWKVLHAVLQAGSVDYKRVPELAGVDLDNYRQKGRFETRVTVGK
jgi:hypothetical protein